MEKPADAAETEDEDRPEVSDPPQLGRAEREGGHAEKGESRN
jgi:hypothetical protein